MEWNRRNALINFLQRELAISDAAIAVALKHPEQDSEHLPMILWQYGLVSLEQLNCIFDWLGEQAIAATHALLDTF